jgi:hypothetical protein
MEEKAQEKLNTYGTASVVFLHKVEKADLPN